MTEMLVAMLNICSDDELAEEGEGGEGEGNELTRNAVVAFNTSWLLVVCVWCVFVHFDLF